MNTSPNHQHKSSQDIGLSASAASRDEQAKPATPAPDPAVVLTEAQRQALEWLSEKNATVADAAEFAGVSRATFYRWIDTDPNFRALYTAWLAQQERFSDAQIFASELTSVDAICQAVRDRRDLSAAKFIVKQAAARRQYQQRLQEQQQRIEERAQERRLRLAEQQQRLQEGKLRLQEQQEQARERAQEREEQRRMLGL